MTYEIGQKVETPLGWGRLSYFDSEFAWVSIKGTPEIEFDIRHIKPYKTAHDKLIDMGFSYEYDECNDELSDKVHTYYNAKRHLKIEVTVTPNGVGWHTHFYDAYNYIANLETLEIIKQLVEELHEK